MKNLWPIEDRRAEQEASQHLVPTCQLMAPRINHEHPNLFFKQIVGFCLTLTYNRVFVPKPKNQLGRRLGTSFGGFGVCFSLSFLRYDVAEDIF